MNILIAEDEDICRKTLADFLAAGGHSVFAAGDGAQAWLLFQEHRERLDLVLLDWMMPPPDGLELTRKIRAAQFNRYMYIILLTARERTEDVVAGLQAGANDYITKPYDQAELEARVNVGRRVVTLERDLARRVQELESALTQVSHLQSLLPICCYCKKIRDDKNYWASVEQYMAAHAGVRFSHAICPACYEKVMAELDKSTPDPRKLTP